MRHRNHSNRLSQKPHHAWMMLRNMLTSLLLYERIRTTKKRAQVLKPLLDRIVTVGKSQRPDLAIRRINEVVTDENACRKVLEVLTKRYASRTSGFSKTIPVGMRKGDGALLVDMELIDGEFTGTAVTDDSEKKVKKAARPKAAASKSATPTQ